MNITIEIERNNVTVAEFLAYIKRRTTQKGIPIGINRDEFSDPRQNICRSYHIKDGIKYNTVIRKCQDERPGWKDYAFMLPDECRETESDGSDAPCVAEISREFPYEWQTYALGFAGGEYNEICEFTFTDEKRGRGYFFLFNKDAPDGMVARAPVDSTVAQTPRPDRIVEVREHRGHGMSYSFFLGGRPLAKRYLLTNGGKQQVSVIPEKDIYRLIFHSRLPEAEAFQDWIFEVIKELRKSLGLSPYEAFRLMDTEHQREEMRKLNESLREPVKVDYIKANIIADKAVSTMHGYAKLVKKPDMDEGMLRARESVLTDTVELMALNQRFGLGLSVSEQVYHKYCTPMAQAGKSA
jgi:prophage antirepressor-like protein